MADKDDWKQRYREGVREWENADRIFRKLVGRLAYVAEGTSPVLDRSLEQIQRHAKTGELASLEGDLEALANAAKAMEIEAPARAATPDNAPEPATGPRDYCLALLEQLKLPQSQAESLLSFRRRLSDLDEEQCLAETAAQLAGLLRAAAEVEGRESAPAGPGHNESPAAPSGVLRDLMLNLIKEVELAQPGMGSLQTLRETVENNTQDDWHLVLSRVIAEIRRIINRISSDKHALAQLVREVGEELNGISARLKDDHSGIVDGRERLGDLQAVMQSGVQEIQDQIEREGDIVTLKQTIGASLEGIREGLSQYMASDEQRIAEAEERNRELQERVQSIEREASALRQQLDSSRDKLLHDTLTGVGSRLAYDEALARELSFARARAARRCRHRRPIPTQRPCRPGPPHPARGAGAGHTCTTPPPPGPGRARLAPNSHRPDPASSAPMCAASRPAQAIARSGCSPWGPPRGTALSSRHCWEYPARSNSAAQTPYRPSRNSAAR